MTVKDYENKAILAKIEKESLQVKDFVGQVSPYDKRQLERVNCYSFDIDKSMDKIDEILDYYKKKHLKREGGFALLSILGLSIQPVASLVFLLGSGVINGVSYLKSVKPAKKVLNMNLDLKDELFAFQSQYENYLDYDQKKEKLFPIVYMEIMNMISHLNIEQARKYLERVKDLCALKDSQTFYFEMKRLEEDIQRETTSGISLNSYEAVGYYYILDELIEFVREYDHICSVIYYAKIKIDSITNEEDRNQFNSKLAQVVLDILVHHEEEFKQVEHMIDIKHQMEMILINEYPELESSQDILREGIQKRKNQEDKLVR